MTKRRRIPLLLDLLTVDAARQMEALNAHPQIHRTLPSGPLLHQVVAARIRAVMTVRGRLLPVFRDRDDAARAAAQAELERDLDGRGPGPGWPAGEIARIAAHVAGPAPDPAVGVAVQQMLGRLFVPGYTATPESVAAARIIGAWPGADPVRSLWWLLTGRVFRARRLIWDLARSDERCIHATAIGIHNVMDAVAAMREAIAAPDADRRDPQQVVSACLTAPDRLLRVARGPVSLPWLDAPLAEDTLVVMELRAAHRGTGDDRLAFSTGQWSQCPARTLVPRLLGAIWEAALAQRGRPPAPPRPPQEPGR